MARRCSEVWTTSGSRPDSRSSSPPRLASFSPLALRSTSTQPVKRFFAFHSLSPWRSSTRVPVMATILHPLSPAADEPLGGDHHVETRLRGREAVTRFVRRLGASGAYREVGCGAGGVRRP